MCSWDKILVSSRVSSGVEMRVVVVLALLLWGISHEVEGGRATSISKEDDLELERELRRLNKPAIKSFQTEYGDIFDCVDINKQPALDHPLLKNHRVQKKPSVFPKGLGPKTSAKTQSSKIGLPDGGCPEGTVPIKRITKRDLLWMKSLKRNTTKFHPMDANTPGYHQVFTRQYPSKYYGAQGGLSLHSEPAANHQSHRAMITVSGGSPDKLNAIQVGWMVNKDAYGDGATRMFVFWTVDNFVNTGCRDLFCPGYVQVDSSVAPGMTFYNLSTVDGPQFDYYFVILQMNATDENWWLMSLGDETRTIGYWPQALFPDMKESFTNLEWGGYVFNDDPKTTTSPQMGSGHFPEEGYGKAAYFRDIKLMRDPQEGFAIVSTEEVSFFTDNPDCYRVGDKADLPGWSGAYNFYYGGPGGNCNR
ncbi:protein neprosin-like [Vitis vinifera]|uniref:protein neprosin-like n=1 Tax=Vitis vinifera TaxID=29760 RepID=UPI0001986345|nr:protein neprosin-like [Vitis vinifera]|eukprot:XP_010662803.1 PREDICTED: uncharacterized protein LOC104882224 [Vitis vinifera]